ncbi:transcription factor HES-5-like [Megalops cyprinoides]|uniref:transcription factor HES-5-like n=1 Tax=Megalops cyprinoides TaxID=118141 RepID=UPI001864E4FD|nr:transcription factor HES-5-like [Megalops cyprinoides]
MAPTVTAAMNYSKEYLFLNNKLRKPMVEKMRRDRINSSIEQLKSLLGPEFLNQNPDSKQEKANILEMTVCFLRRQHQHQQVNTMSCSAAVSEGYSKGIQEAVNFLSQYEVKTPSQRRLLSHFQTLKPFSDKSSSYSVLPQLSSPARYITSKEETSASSALWRPW